MGSVSLGLRSNCGVGTDAEVYDCVGVDVEVVLQGLTWLLALALAFDVDVGVDVYARGHGHCVGHTINGTTRMALTIALPMA